MKVPKSSILIALISILGVSIYSGNAEGANWKSYGKKYSNTTDYLYFYDKDSVVYPNKGIVRVWVKHVTTEEGLKKMRREDEIERERWKAEGEKTKAKREREKAKLREKEDPKMQELLEVVRKVTAEIKGMVIEKEKTLLFEMNCSQRTFRILECYSYYEDGSHSPRGWIDVSPTVTLSEFPTGWYNVYVDYNGPQNLDSVISYTWEIKGGGPSGTNAKEVSAFI